MDENLIGTSPLVIKPQFSPLQELGLSLDSDGHLDEDVMCRNCDYNLRGLKLNGNCPECETAIDLTLHPSLVRFSDTAWLKRVRSGLKFMLAYILGVILLNIFWMVATFAFGIGFSSRSIGLEACITIFLVVLLSLQIIAYMRMTTLESTVHLEDARISSRRLARIALIASVMAGSISMMTKYNRIAMFFSGINEIQLLMQVSKWTGVISQLVGLIGLFALFVYARSLAQRFPADRLAKHTRLVMWGCMIPLMALILFNYAVEFTRTYGLIQVFTDEIFNFIMIVQFVFGIPIFVFGIWAIILLFKYCSQFTKAMKLAA